MIYLLPIFLCQKLPAVPAVHGAKPRAAVRGSLRLLPRSVATACQSAASNYE